MKKDKRILIFIGTIKKVANCGESMKNHLFIERFREVFDKVITVDVWAPKKHPWNVLKMVLIALTHPHTQIAMSVSISTGDKILHWLQSLGCDNVYYWAVGGTMHLRMKDHHLDPNPYKQLKAIYVQSPRIVQGLKEFGITNVIHVNNSKRIDYIPSISDRNNEKVRFVFLSRVHPDKGCAMIVNCVRRLNEQGYNSRFCVDFYGKIDEKYSDFLPMIASTNNVSYKGFLDLTCRQGYDTLAMYDMMLFPTYWDGEGFPGVVIDAYIAGIPIIASNWSCNEEVVDGSTGVIIPHHNEDALYRAMKTAIDGGFNLKQLAGNCQKKAREYDNRCVLSEENLRKIGFIQ